MRKTVSATAACASCSAWGVSRIEHANIGEMSAIGIRSPACVRIARRPSKSSGWCGLRSMRLVRVSLTTFSQKSARAARWFCASAGWIGCCAGGWFTGDGIGFGLGSVEAVVLGGWGGWGGDTYGGG